MKCPKCGSKLNMELKYSGDKYAYQCLSCGKKYGITNLETFEYQARLDKALSKFTKSDKTNYEYYEMYYPFMEDGVILYEHPIFKLSSWSDEVIISLDTVESLIKDLEEENE